MLKCSCCKCFKDQSCFSKNSSRKSGFSHNCKECIAKRKYQIDNAKHYYKHANYYRIKALFRKKQVKQATPKWLSKEDKLKIYNIYLHAKDCQTVTGELYHIDHIVPLQGEFVCGLHVPWNLCVLPAEVNIRKSNRYAGT